MTKKELRLAFLLENYSFKNEKQAVPNQSRNLMHLRKCKQEWGFQQKRTLALS